MMDPKDEQLAGSHRDPTPQLPLPKQNPAAELLRQKIESIYQHEPTAKQELAEVQSLAGHQKLSKHQSFMLELGKSGKSDAQIQTEWHEYYAGLNDSQKHQVWQEFYDVKQVERQAKKPPEAQVIQATHNVQPASDENVPKKTPAELKKAIRRNVQAGSQLSPKQHFKALGFGIATGLTVLIILLFGFFNERFVAPFITPNKAVTSTPIISDGGAVVSKDPKIVIPKINVEIPVVYGVGSVDEKAVQKALEGGVVHYANTPVPGQQGNSVIVGHSSNNIFNRGQYKFAFVLLSKMENGDTFMMEKDGVRYTYKVSEKKVVAPNDLSVLRGSSNASTVTLITCDPPGTSINRLIVVGEQISPDPGTNSEVKVATAPAQPAIIPGNAPSLWSRFTDWLF